MVKLRRDEISVGTRSSAGAELLVLILDAGGFQGAALRSAVEQAVPSARFLEAACCEDARQILRHHSVDLLIVRMGSQEEDVVDFLFQVLRGNDANLRTLAVTPRATAHLLAAFRAFGLAGVFDAAADSAVQFVSAVHSVLHGTPYWSEHLLLRAVRECVHPGAPYARLTMMEKLLLTSCAERDGGVSVLAAMDVERPKVKRLERTLVRKLDVRGKTGLLHAAVELGFVRLTNRGFAPCGLAWLIEACREEFLRTGPAKKIDAVGATSRFRYRHREIYHSVCHFCFFAWAMLRRKNGRCHRFSKRGPRSTTSTPQRSFFVSSHDDAYSPFGSLYAT